MALVERIARERAIGVLFTEHDMDVVFGHADRMLVLNRGELIAEGKRRRGARATPTCAGGLSRRRGAGGRHAMTARRLSPSRASMPPMAARIFF
jgi:energy-coupling factor transporter ATP-binding protein EcfA2